MGVVRQVAVSRCIRQKQKVCILLCICRPAFLHVAKCYLLRTSNFCCRCESFAELLIRLHHAGKTRRNVTVMDVRVLDSRRPSAQKLKWPRSRAVRGVGILTDARLLCTDPKRSTQRTALGEEEIGASERHLHRHGVGVAPKS